MNTKNVWLKRPKLSINNVLWNDGRFPDVIGEFGKTITVQANRRIKKLLGLIFRTLTVSSA